MTLVPNHGHGLSKKLYIYDIIYDYLILTI